MEKATKGRILTLDLLRGYFLVVIIIDHLFRFPSLFELFTGRGQLWVSAAEGFFIISGLLVGYIYREKITESPKRVFEKVWRRAGKLYLVSIGLTFLFTVWGWLLNSPAVKTGIWATSTDVPLMIWKTVTLNYVYGWADFLPYYAVFLFFAPFALWFLTKRHGAVVLSSVIAAVWVFRGQSFYLAWQTLFFGGLIAGFYYIRMEGFFAGQKDTIRRILRRSLLTSATATLFISLFFVFGIWTIFRAPWVNDLPQWLFQLLTQLKDWYYPIQTSWFGKESLPPIRLALSALWFTALLVVFRKFENLLARLFGGALLEFGRNSLFVYVIHGFILFPSFLFLPGGTNFWGNTVIGAVTLGVVYLLVVAQQRVLGKVWSR